MTRTPAQIARILGTNVQEVKTLAYRFREQLGQSANPGKGKVREFEDADALAMIFVVINYPGEADADSAIRCLEDRDHFEDRYWDYLYMHTPLLQDPPEGLNEDWRHGSLYTPSFFTPLELARNYRWCADSLLEAALAQDAALDLRSPVLFAYRHALELYLKIFGRVDWKTHSLRECLVAVERRNKGKLREPYRSWILEVDTIDPGGTSFRYDLQDAPQGLGEERWMDYRHLRFVMSKLFQELDLAILDDHKLWRRSSRV